MLKITTFCTTTSCIMSEPVSIIILGCVVGLCLVNVNSLFQKPKKNQKGVKKPKTIYTSEEEQMYLADDKDGPIWF